MMSPSRLLPFILPVLLLVGCAKAPPPEPETPPQADPALDLAIIATDSARSGDAETAAEQFRMLIEMKPDFPRDRRWIITTRRSKPTRIMRQHT